MQKTSEFSSMLLDVARSIAATTVVIGHLRNHFFLAYAQIEGLSAFEHVFFAAAAFQHAAVMVFFVISGYLVGGGLVLAEQRGAVTVSYLGKYALTRVVRLEIVLVPVMLVTLLVAASSLTQLPASPNSLSLGAFLANVFFLQTIIAPAFGGNYPLWSLANEFWYYVLFPLGILIFRVRPLALSLGLLGAAVLAAGWLLGMNIIAYMMIWLFGVVARCAPLQSPPRVLVIFFVFAWVGAILASRVWFSGGYLPIDLLVGAIFAILLLVSRSACTSPAEWLRAPFRFVSGFSYSMYVVHVPMIFVFAEVFGVTLRRGDTGVDAWVGFAGIFAAVVVSAWVLSLLTERHTSTVRDWLWSRFVKADADRAEARVSER